MLCVNRKEHFIEKKEKILKNKKNGKQFIATLSQHYSISTAIQSVHCAHDDVDATLK